MGNKWKVISFLPVLQIPSDKETTLKGSKRCPRIFAHIYSADIPFEKKSFFAHYLVCFLLFILDLKNINSTRMAQMEAGCNDITKPVNGNKC